MKNNYILIVDDDEEIRKGLSRVTSEEFKGKAKVLSCRNGAEAAEVLRSDTIDILITDIKMPVMGGIELLSFVREHRLSCRSIVLSSYDDFNLVRDAMRLGAVDYLLKPVDFSELNHMLYKLLTQVLLEHNRYNPVNTPVNTWKLLEDYLADPLKKSSEMTAFEEKYGLSEDSACITGCIKLQTVSSEKSFKLQEAFREDLYSSLSMAHFRYHTLLSGEAASCFVFLIFLEAKDKYHGLDILDSFRNRVSNEGFNIKISESHFKLKEIPLAVNECLSWFELGYYDLTSSAHEGLTFSDLQSFLSKGISALCAYDMKMTLYHLSRYFSAVNSLKPPVSDTKKALNNMIYEVIRQNPKYIEPISHSKLSDNDIFHIIETSPSLSILQKRMFDALNSFVEQVIHSLPDKEDCIISKARAYIDSNYNDCITLEDVAAHVYLNKSYFSTFFKSKTGLTFRDYLRNYRIEKAITLLTTSSMKIYEIAQAVGYSDSAHFIRAFKKVTGKKPEDYANRTAPSAQDKTF